jgi:DNA-binding CsgD family transcriptional regulator
LEVSEAIDLVESCTSLDELRTTFQRLVGNYGFASFAYVDVGHPEIDDPFVLATTDPAWDQTYRSNGFLHVDPMIPLVRRTNVPFHWGEVALPPRLGKRKPGAHKVMEAAHDHGLKEGLVVPFHFVDKLGRVNSASCVFFWKDAPSRFLFTLRHKKRELHLLMIYWAQKVTEIADLELKRRHRLETNEAGDPLQEITLTDRERDVLTWAARGKTLGETAMILSISIQTVDFYTRNALKKLGAHNKTHGAVIAARLGLIDV